MKASEANQIIAEYMGFTVYSSECEIMPQGMSHVREDFLTYDKSLDALVPVWEKLNTRITRLGFIYENNSHRFGLEMPNVSKIIWHEGGSIQEAAAIATAKAIKELGREGE